MESSQHMVDQPNGPAFKISRSAWIAQEEERDQLTREALADVDAGRVIEHNAVQAWAERLGTSQQLPVPR